MVTAGFGVASRHRRGMKAAQQHTPETIVIYFCGTLPGFDRDVRWINDEGNGNALALARLSCANVVRKDTVECFG